MSIFTQTLIDRDSVWVIPKLMVREIGLQETIMLMVHVEVQSEEGNPYTITRQELEERVYFSEKVQKRLEDRLIELGFLKRRYIGLPPENTFTLNLQAIEDFLME